SGGGIINDRATLALGNTIVALNVADWAVDVIGTASSRGFNLIGDPYGSSGWISSDLRGSPGAALDPKLVALANNGGPTMTMALLSGSLAIDKGRAFSLTADQRG